MKHLKKFSTKTNLVQGVALYLEPLFLKKYRAVGLHNYKQIKGEEFVTNWEFVTNKLNKKYKDCFILPLDKTKIIVGCLIDPNCDYESIINEIYNSYSAVAYNEIKLVYGLGIVDIRKNVMGVSLHYVPATEIMVKVGKKLDDTTVPGIFKVD